MTTNQAPNPREFKSWEDAFQYPVPVVRRLEQQLRTNINENSDKLRSLVGNSYRDLLSTAERIVEMDQQIHSIDTCLGNIGSKCNARAIERIAANQRKTANAQRNRNHVRNALASNIALLQRCMAHALQLIRRGNHSLRAAKLLVISRLLYTSASKSPDPPALLDHLKTKLTSLRRKLLSHVDKYLVSATLEKSALVDTLAAFSLATTSTPTDVLNHFLHVRASSLGDLVKSPTQAQLHDALGLLITTIKEVQIVFPKQLSALLGRIQDEPLLQGSAIQDMPELSLEIYESWISDDVRKFTPWLRHDQLQGSAATVVLKKWVAQARSTLMQGLNSLLDDTHEVSVVVSLRKDFISRSLSADRKLPGLDPATFFEELRASFNRRLRDLVVESANVGEYIVGPYLRGEYIQSIVNPGPAANLWDPANLEIEPGKGSITFRNLIHNASQGKDASLQGLVLSLNSWSSDLATWSTTIKSMRDDRWNDDLDLGIEDDFEIDSPQDLLAREDPDELQKLLASEKAKSLKDAYEQIQSYVDKKGRTVRSLRLLRGLRHQAALGETQTSITQPPPSLFQTLHEMLAEQVLEKSVELKRSTTKSPKLFVRAPATALWEGSPPLPVQPSPACFRYLHDTCKTMTDIGSDLWSPSALSILKNRLRSTIFDSLNDTLLSTTHTNGSTTTAAPSSVIGDTSINGESKPDFTEDGVSVDDKAQEQSTNTNANTTFSTQSIPSPKLIQATFDILYLDKILAVSNPNTASFDTAISNLKSKAELEDAAIERLRKSTGDYYKRTYLLFGLLAV
ncbi:hypothetical protein M436DRAFT_57940 [Aureobasidium namibiae CBS 147.97]|uniref:Conserved oligomeric Golgi complex subunit 1 n=1 Tax=Aureobasidium namibiae CBS 147.97 TaxID=1043004 RepID=A0A074X1Y5_9PEZI